jgi:hypothetical protein
LAGCGGEKAEPLASAQAGVTADCTHADSESGFVTRGFERQGGTFELELDATPSVAPSDSLVGVTLGGASSYADLAAIVRFNPDGFIDARNGSDYEASTAIPYTAGVTRHLLLGIDLLRRTYSVTVDDQSLAYNYDFRSEQAGAVALDGVTLKVDAGDALDVCNLQVHTTLACVSATPGEGFVNTSLAASPAFSVSFEAIPRAADMDGVMGVSTGAAAAFPTLAGAVRFGPSGDIDALDGASYSVWDGAYTANQPRFFVLVADAVEHTYSVFDTGTDTVARNFAFRPQQANAASLGNFAEVSDSDAGAVTVCNLRGGGAAGTAWIHDAARYGGAAFSLAVSNDRPLLSDASHTLVLDATGAVTQSIPFGGTSVADAHGNLYLLGKFTGTYDGGTGPVQPTAGGGNVYVSKYDADFNPIYTQAEGASSNVTFASPSADGQGDVAFVLRDPTLSPNSGSAVKLDAAGETLWTTDYSVIAVALDGAGNALVASGQANSVTVSKLDTSGNPLWTQTFATSGVSLRGVVFDSLGDAAFIGSIDGTIQFGGSTFTARTEEDGSEGLYGLLGPDGTPRFVTTTSMQSIKRAIADGAGHVFVAGTHVNADEWALDRFDADGVRSTRSSDDLIVGLPLGSSGDVAVDSAGQVYWQVFPRLGGTAADYLIKLLPF